MHYQSTLVAAMLQLFFAFHLVQANHLNLTTVALDNNNITRFECWQLEAPLNTYDNTEITSLGLLGGTTDAEFLIIPSGATVGPGPAGPVQYAAVLSGQILLKVVASGQQAIVNGGVHGLVFVAEPSGFTVNVLSDTSSVIVTMPVQDNAIPDHIFLHFGQCTDFDMSY